ncbi:hypothetical protein C8J56DRAFT_757221, partial [Mycena floridula]
RFSPDNKMTAVRLRMRGLDSPKEISLLTQISVPHLYRIWSTYRLTGAVNRADALPAGRPRALVSQDVQYLLSLARYRPTLFLDEYQKLLSGNRHLAVSLATIHRTFERAGINVKQIQKMAKE